MDVLFERPLLYFSSLVPLCRVVVLLHCVSCFYTLRMVLELKNHMGLEFRREFRSNPHCAERRIHMPGLYCKTVFDCLICNVFVHFCARLLHRRSSLCRVLVILWCLPPEGVS